MANPFQAQVLNCSTNIMKLEQETNKPHNQIYKKGITNVCICKSSKTHLLLQFPFSWVSLPFNTQNSHTQNFGLSIPKLSLQNHINKLPNLLMPFNISNVSRLGHSNFKPNNCLNFVYPMEI
jgi:hypothetical protein